MRVAISDEEQGVDNSIAVAGHGIARSFALLTCLAAVGAAAARGPADPHRADPVIADPQPSAARHDPDLLPRYALAMRAAIERRWVRPPGLKPNTSCAVEIRQAPSGKVVSARATARCQFDEQGRASVEAAVRKADPLPYDGYESVFARTVVLNFRIAVAEPGAADTP
jgi:colicin import membrane protein